LHTGSWFGDLKESDRWDNLGVDEKVILKRIFKKRDGETWTRFIWLRIRKGDGLL
jgi:hypothetical protein